MRTPSTQHAVGRRRAPRRRWRPARAPGRTTRRPAPRASRWRWWRPHAGRSDAARRRVVGEQLAEEPLAAGRHEHRIAECSEGVEVGQHRPVLLAGLGEAEAGVDDDLLGPDAGGQRLVDLRTQLVDDVLDDVVVLRELLHAVGVAAPVHQHDRHAGRAATWVMRSSARPPETSLMSTAPASSARSATSARIVSTDTVTPCADQAGDDGDDAAQLLLGVDAQRTGPGGLAADVDDVGALGDELEPVADGGVGVEPLAAVGEGVGGDVDHPHDAAASRSEQTCSAHA